MRKSLAICLWLITATHAHAQSASDLFLVQLQENAGRLTAGNVTRLTDRDGYNNQPNFLPGTLTVLYTVIDSTGQADIWRYDLTRGTASPVTRTRPESEYSATPIPGSERISVVRVEADSTQRLWSFRRDGSVPRVMLEDIKPVGYHAWIDENRVVVFVLGKPATLQLVDKRNGAAVHIADNVGRAIQRVPGGRSISFVQIRADSTKWIETYDPDAATTKPLLQAFAENEFHTWTPSGILLSARGSVLYQWNPKAGGDWTAVADLTSAGIYNITRMSVSGDGHQLVLVAAHAAPQPKN